MARYTSVSQNMKNRMQSNIMLEILMHLLCLTSAAKEELKWRVNNIERAKNQINRLDADITIRTDASTQGWGCAINDQSTGEHWTTLEKKNHIDYLELLAVLFGLQAYKQLLLGKHVKVFVYTTVQIIIIKMGISHSPKLNDLVKTHWDCCIEHNVWITVARISGKENIEADSE